MDKDSVCVCVCVCVCARARAFVSIHTHACAHTQSEVLIGHKKNKITSFEAIWIDLEKNTN